MLCLEDPVHAGGIFLAAGNASLTGLQMQSNAALLGGGFFISANLAESVVLAGLALQNNFAILGEASSTYVWISICVCICCRISIYTSTCVHLYLSLPYPFVAPSLCDPGRVFESASVSSSHVHAFHFI